MKWRWVKIALAILLRRQADKELVRFATGKFLLNRGSSLIKLD